MAEKNPEKRKDDTTADEPIKSPFQFSERMQKVIRDCDIKQDIIDGFAATLHGFDHLGLEPDETTLTAYMSGFTCTLKAFGIPQKSAMRLTEEIALEIVKIGLSKPDDDTPCNCPNCRGKN